MNNVLIFVLSSLFLVLPYGNARRFLNVYPRGIEYHLADGEDVGTPLFLTPLIEDGKIEEARGKAVVQHKDMGDINSYSGYLTVNKTYNSNLFFWFFPAMVCSISNFLDMLNKLTIKEDIYCDRPIL